MSEGSKKGGQLIGITVQTHWHRTVLDRTGQADKDWQIPDYRSYCGSPLYFKITSKVPQESVRNSNIFEPPIPITNHLKWYVWIDFKQQYDRGLYPRHCNVWTKPIVQNIDRGIICKFCHQVAPLALSHCLRLPYWHHRFVLSESLSDGQ